MVEKIKTCMKNDILLSLLIGCMSFEIMNKNNKEEKNISITNNNHTNIT